MTDSNLVLSQKQSNEETVNRTFGLKPNTKRNAVLKPGAPATVYYHKEGNVAAQVDLVEALKGLLVPGDEPDPPLRSPHPDIPSNALRVFLGGVLAFTSADEVTVLEIKGIDVLGLRRTPTGIALLAKVFSQNGRIVAEVVDNRLYLNPLNRFRVVTPDSHSLAVYDTDGEELLGVRYMNPHSFRVVGTFELPEGPPVVITQSEMRVGNFVMSGGGFGGSGTLVQIP